MFAVFSNLSGSIADSFRKPFFASHQEEEMPWRDVWENLSVISPDNANVELRTKMKPIGYWLSALAGISNLAASNLRPEFTLPSTALQNIGYRIDKGLSTVINGVMPWNPASGHVIPLPLTQSSPQTTADDDVRKRLLFQFSCVTERENLNWGKVLRQIGETLKNPVERMNDEILVIHSHHAGGGCSPPDDKEIAQVADSILSFVITSLPEYGKYVYFIQNICGTALTMLADGVEGKPLDEAKLAEINQHVLMFAKMVVDNLPRDSAPDLSNANFNSGDYIPRHLTMDSDGFYVKINKKRYAIKLEGNDVIGVRKGEEYFLVYSHDDKMWQANKKDRARVNDDVICFRPKRMLEGACAPAIPHPAVTDNDKAMIDMLHMQLQDKIAPYVMRVGNKDIKYLRQEITHIPYYDGAVIYTLTDANLQPIDGMYVIEMNGKTVEVKQTIIPKHGVRYDIIDDITGKRHPLRWEQGWRFEAGTDSGPATGLRNKITIKNKMFVNHIDEGNISPPDINGYRWDKEDNCYLKINHRYISVVPFNNRHLDAFRVLLANGKNALVTNEGETAYIYLLDTSGEGLPEASKRWIVTDHETLKLEIEHTQYGFRNPDKSLVYRWEEAHSINPQRTDFIKINLRNAAKVCSKANAVVKKMGVVKLAVELGKRYPGILFSPEDVRVFMRHMAKLEKTALAYTDNYMNEVRFVSHEDVSALGLRVADAPDVVYGASVRFHNVWSNSQVVTKLFIGDHFFKMGDAVIIRSLIHEMLHVTDTGIKDFFYYSQDVTPAGDNPESINGKLASLKAHADKQLADCLTHDTIDDARLSLRIWPAGQLKDIIGDNQPGGVALLYQNKAVLSQAIKMNADSLADATLYFYLQDSSISETTLTDTHALLSSPQTKVDFPSRSLRSPLS